MKILFATGHPHLPQFHGGSQSSTHELALAFMARGHEVAVLCSLWGAGLVGLRSRLALKLLRRPAARDRVAGYDVYRKWAVAEDVEDIVAEVRPDVAVVMAMHPVPVARALSDAGAPTLVYLRDVDFGSLGGDPRELEDVAFLANSQFTASRYREEFGIEADVLPPLFDASRYRVEGREGRFVTFINPTPVKGLHLALEIAALCPEIPFLFVESWPLEPEERRALLAWLDRLPNVTFAARSADMKRVYGRTKILLAPSQCEEAWGRVATEAQFSAIPVLASEIGGLPEAVGPGGVLVPATSPANVWGAEVRRLWNDAEIYGEKSSAAVAYSRRADLDPGTQIASLEVKLGRLLQTPLREGVKDPKGREGLTVLPQ
ncbi:MAG: glycosyltransferase [Ignavibacteriales bacterium]